MTIALKAIFLFLSSQNKNLIISPQRKSKNTKITKIIKTTKKKK